MPIQSMIAQNAGAHADTDRRTGRCALFQQFQSCTEVIGMYAGRNIPLTAFLRVLIGMKNLRTSLGGFWIVHGACKSAGSNQPVTV